MLCIVSRVFLLCNSADDLIVDQSIDAICGDSALRITVSRISSLSLFLVLLVYDQLLQRHKVKLRTGKLSMEPFRTIFAWVNLELINDCSVLIAHETEVVVVHLRFL